MAEEMGFWGHVDALRSTVMHILLAVFVLAVGFFAFMPWIFDHVITAPCDGDFALYRLFAFVKGDGRWLPDLSDEGFHVQLINIELASQFYIHISASFYAAFVVAFPYAIYEIWKFVSPGLYDHEKRGAGKAFFFGNVLFYIGMAVGYYLIFPLVLRFLADYNLSDKIDSTVSLTSYMDSFYMILLMMGLLFEIPLLAWMLGKAGILKRSLFSAYRKHAIVAILILAALITPTSDIFTLTLVFLPVYALWEFSAMLVPRQ